ncbi:MAG: beta-ketoacyl-[acyl-carrier-protein] synthase family protein [Myxococcota bacterium]
MRPPRTVVTGLGVLSSVGVGLDAFWSAVQAGTVGTGPITRFDASELRASQAGELGPLDDGAAFERQPPGRFQRATRLAVTAARAAAQDAGLDVSAVADRAGVVMGVVVANRPGLESAYSRLYEHGAGEQRLATHEVALVSEAPAIELGCRGPVMVLPTACAAGNSAIGFASDMIAAGRADVMFAGGADELSPAMFMMFAQFDSFSQDVVRPFDAQREGLILSEGSAVLVLEAEHHARARGARIYAVVGGHGNFADAHDMTHPHPDGLGARLSMQAALADADLRPCDVDYVSAHGTGTPANDAIEAKAIRDVFGAHTDVLPVSSIKSMLGHSQGAASAIESVACCLAIRDGLVPPTMNIRELDTQCPIDPVAGQVRRHRVDVALNNAFGFGGNVSCVVFARP